MDDKARLVACDLPNELMQMDSKADTKERW